MSPVLPPSEVRTNGPSLLLAWISNWTDQAYDSQLVLSVQGPVHVYFVESSTVDSDESPVAQEAEKLSMVQVPCPQLIVLS